MGKKEPWQHTPTSKHSTCIFKHTKHNFKIVELHKMLHRPIPIKKICKVNNKLGELGLVQANFLP